MVWNAEQWCRKSHIVKHTYSKQQDFSEFLYYIKYFVVAEPTFNTFWRIVYFTGYCEVGGKCTKKKKVPSICSDCHFYVMNMMSCQ